VSPHPDPLSGEREKICAPFASGQGLIELFAEGEFINSLSLEGEGEGEGNVRQLISEEER
jgi:hypothetical protein